MMRLNLSLGVSDKNEIQTNLLHYRDQLENRKYTCSKFRYDSFKLANNTGADQAVQMHRLVCAFVIRTPPKTGFLV